jgi:hypothetical protein
MDTVAAYPGPRKWVSRAALTGGTWVQNPAVTVAANVGRRNGSLIGRYDGNGFAHVRAGRIHEPRLNCIAVGLNGGIQGSRAPGEDTVGSPKQVAPVQADTRGKNVSVALVQTGAVVRVSRSIQRTRASV